jgi:hypothetical protein
MPNPDFVASPARVADILARQKGPAPTAQEIDAAFDEKAPSVDSPEVSGGEVGSEIDAQPEASTEEPPAPDEEGVE